MMEINSNEIRNHANGSDHWDVPVVTFRELAHKRLEMAEGLFALCGNQTAKEWQECLAIAWRVVK